MELSSGDDDGITESKLVGARRLADVEPEEPLVKPLKKR